MTGMVIRTCAKVNLGLRVLGKRRDGYHDVETVLHTIGLWDKIMLMPLPSPGDISLEVIGSDIPADESNLCWQAARILLEHNGMNRGVAIRLEKSIPIAAGLGGGSSDAAATLVGLAKLWQLEITPQQLEEMAGQLGADAPFFIRGGCCLARGRGDKLECLPGANFWLVVVAPPQRISTAVAYLGLRRGAIDKVEDRLTPELKRVVKAVKMGDTSALARAIHNDFEALDTPAMADALRVKEFLLEAGCLGAGLSGSGSAVFGIAADQEAAEAIAEQAKAQWGWAAVAPTVRAGEHITIRELL